MDGNFLLIYILIDGVDFVCLKNGSISFKMIQNLFDTLMNSMGVLAFAFSVGLVRVFALPFLLII